MVNRMRRWCYFKKWSILVTTLFILLIHLAVPLLFFNTGIYLVRVDWSSVISLLYSNERDLIVFIEEKSDFNNRLTGVGLYAIKIIYQILPTGHFSHSQGRGQILSIYEPSTGIVLTPLEEEKAQVKKKKKDYTAFPNIKVLNPYKPWKNARF